jgi:hypothetical protein
MTLFRLMPVFLLVLFLQPVCASAQRASRIDPSTLFQTSDAAGNIVTCAEHPRTGKSITVEPRGAGYVAVNGTDRVRCGSIRQSKRKGRGAGVSVSSKSLRLGVIAPSVLVSVTAAQLERMTFAVLEASNQAGVARTTGTLTQVSQSPLQYQYSPQPTDRLRGVQLDGTVYEFIIQEIQGDFTFGAFHFFQQDHRLVFQATEVGVSNILIEDIQVNKVRTIRVTGNGVFDGTLLTVDVTGEGMHVSDVTYRTSLRGTITGAGIAVNVSEVSDSAQADMGYGFATKLQELYSRRINTSWKVGGVTFALRNGSILAKFRSGAPIEYGDPTRWFAKGTLLVGGKSAGRLQMTRKGGSIGVILTAGKASTVLQSWRL